jgi:hypothetical protein
LCVYTPHGTVSAHLVSRGRRPAVGHPSLAAQPPELPSFEMSLLVSLAIVSRAPNATLCDVESCMVLPTGCMHRAECAGCGALCDAATNVSAAGYDAMLSSTGLSMQGDFTTVKPGVPWTKQLLTADMVLTWKEVQPQPPPAALDWSGLTDAIARARAASPPKRLSVLLWTGQDAPEYAAGTRARRARIR